MIFLEAFFFSTILSLLSCVIFQASFLSITHPHTFWLFLTLWFWSHVCVFRGFCEHHKIAVSKHPLLTVTRFASMVRIKPVQPFPPCDSLYRFKYTIRATHVIALTGFPLLEDSDLQGLPGWSEYSMMSVSFPWSFALCLKHTFKVYFYGAFIWWV